MNRIVCASLAILLAGILTGCGSDSVTSGSGGQTFNQGQIYNGFVLGRVKLARELQPGPVEIVAPTGQVLYTVQANAPGYFHFRGVLPPDFFVRAKRGNDTYELEHHGAWQGGTLYVNAGTTLAADYHRSHSNLTLDQVEQKIRRYYKLPGDMPMSWLGVVRTEGFKNGAFFTELRASGGLAAYLSVLSTRLDTFVSPSILEDLATDVMGAVYNGFISSAVGDSVSSALGLNFTTADALANIEGQLTDVQSALKDIQNQFSQYAAIVSLEGTLQNLKNDGETIDLSVANITQSVKDFRAAHASDSDYGVPRFNSDVSTIIGQIRSLNLDLLTTDISNSLSDTSALGVYQQLLKVQMTNLNQTDTHWNNYPWQINKYTDEQRILLSSLAGSLSQAQLLEAEYARLQTGNLAGALNGAAARVSQLSQAIQQGSQQIPDLLASDDVVAEPGANRMWNLDFMGQMTASDAKSAIDNLEIGPYKDWMVPTQPQLNGLIFDRIVPAASPSIVVDNNTWDDVSSSVFPGAFGRMGFDTTSYGTVSGNNNEGCWFDDGGTIKDYEWNGTDGPFGNSNPSTTSLSDDVTSNTLAVRELGGLPEQYGYYTSLPYGTYTGDAGFVGPLQYGGIYRYYLELSGESTSLTNQLLCQAMFLTPNRTYFAPNPTNGEAGLYNISNRVVWTSSDPATASISNFPTQQTTNQYSYADVAGGWGRVTWHPPLDPSQPIPSVTFTASFFAVSDNTGVSTKTWTASQTLSPPANCQPILTSILAQPFNQILDVTQGSVNIPMSLLAFYQDGRAFDISTDPNTTWTLTDDNQNVLNSSSTGGFGVVTNSAKNLLTVSSGIATNNVIFTANYNGRWGNKTFTGKVGLQKAAPTITSITPAFGPAAGGNIIRINGTGFTADSVAYFGNTRATSTFFVTANQLTVTVPPGNVGAAAVTVHTGGATTNNPANYNYTN